jgi:LmbE family N-acetylglucosaminyl deacetylase
MKRKLIQTTLALLVVSFLLTAPRAQQTAPAAQSPEDRVALYQTLLDLTNPWTVMCIAAHPDDEDGTSLIVMRRKYGAHTVSLFSTFGEGGQNAIGPELYEELGAIRARETMAAAEIQGSEPHFLGLKDFGYSKTRDEAFRFWGHEEGLRRMVLEIRKLRPDVIITNHSVTSNDHGQHQATALMVVEAFDAAADPKRFPEQLKDGVTVWQVQRLFVRNRGNAAQNTNPQGATEQVVTIDPNEQDPVRGTVFAEEALRALQKHATQGPWPKTFAEFAARFRAFSGQSGATGQMPLIRYRLTREAKGAEALPKDSHNFVDGLQVRPAIAKRFPVPTIDGQSIIDFVNQRERVLEALVKAKNNVPLGLGGEPSDEPRHSMMLQRLDSALAVASGISATLTTTDDVLIQDARSQFTLTILNRGDSPATVRSVLFDTLWKELRGSRFTNHNVNSSLLPGKSVPVTLDYRPSKNSRTTLPHAKHLYDEGFAGKKIEASALVWLNGTSFDIHASTTRDVVPQVEMTSVTPSPVVVSPRTADGANTVLLRITNHLRSAFTGKVWDWATSIPLSLQGGESREVPFRPRWDVSGGPAVIYVGMPSTARAGTATSLPPEGALDEVYLRLVKVDARVISNLRIGYIRGFDYSLPNALAALGVESKELTVDEVKTADLQKYTSIIVDNRVYESEPELIAANQKLLDYAKDGGTLIVFYHKSNEWNPDPRRNRPALAPYKLILGDERITDETAPITFIEPDHPLLNTPNKLGQEDFKDWIQERGLYYPKDWDPQYHALLQSNDPGEAPLKGGLLVADYGRGHYIYTSMVWYRELRGGIPGAYRMLANMISYGRSK